MLFSRVGRRLSRRTNILEFAVLHSRNVSFRDLNVDLGLARKLRSYGIQKPTSIQVQASKVVSNGESVVLNSETGSGKTLAYALPIVQSLRKLKLEKLQVAKPYALVIVPSTELAFQVGKTFEQFLSARVWVASENSHLFLNNVDVVVSTAPYISTFPLNVFNEVQTLVIDEADILIARKMGKHGKKDPLFKLVKHFLQPENFKEITFGKRQFIFAGATMPDNSSRKSKMAMPYIKSWIPDICILQNENAHRLLRNVTMEFASILEGNKFKKFVSTVNCYYGDNVQLKTTTCRIIAFVNKVETAIQLHRYLTQRPSSAQIEADVCIANDFLDEFSRFYNIWNQNIFVLHKNKSVEERVAVHEEFSMSHRAILITTDVSSRGLDFPDVDLVMQYDFATNVIDILHRVGRTGRMGKQGKVMNFITDRDERLSHQIQLAIKEGKPFDSLFSRNRSLQRKVKRHVSNDINHQHADEKEMRS